MTITAKHNRIAVGLKCEEWNVVYYEPIQPPEDLTTPHCAPVIGLYSRSRGDAREDDPMIGEVAWEPLLSDVHIKSGVKKERLHRQREILYDAWRYMVATEPFDIATIKAQLQASRKGTVLLMQLDQARKARCSRTRQTRQRREKRRQKMIEQGLPAESVERDDDEEDSGLGSDGEGEESDQEARMPPPPALRFRMPSSVHGGLRASQPRRSRTREVSSAFESDDDVVEIGSNASIPRSRGSAPANASRSKRRPQDSSGVHSPRRHTEGSEKRKTLLGNKLLITPANSQAKPQGDKDHGDRQEGSIVHGGNGDFEDEHAATAEAVRRSMMPEEPMNLDTEDFESGLEDDDQ